MRVLVTGAGGFAGGHMARRLAEAGHHVLALTRRSPVEAPRDPGAAGRVDVVHADLADPASLPGGYDAVVHTAATSIWHGISVDQMITDNVTATQHLIRHALKVRARSFVFFSSLSAFGNVSVDRLDEAVPTVDPDAYGATKLLGEQALADVADRLPSLSIRLPAVIGRGSKRNWPSEVLRKLRAGEDLNFFNPDTPFNNVVHEADLASLVATGIRGDLAEANMVVVGSSGETTSGQVVSRIAEATGSKSTIKSQIEERHAFLIDFSLATRLFGFHPMPVLSAIERLSGDKK
ncbi:MAG: NAD(P)-dependent oxidoreductase [Pseudomonadota bacterium]